MSDKPDHIDRLIHIFRPHAEPHKEKLKETPPPIFKIEDRRPPERKPA